MKSRDLRCPASLTAILSAAALTWAALLPGTAFAETPTGPSGDAPPAPAHAATPPAQQGASGAQPGQPSAAPPAARPQQPGAGGCPYRPGTLELMA